MLGLALLPGVAASQTPAAPATNANQSAGSVEDLLSALRAGNGARTVTVKAGTYRTLTIDGIRPDGQVRIIAADPASPPVFNQIVVTNSRNLSFENIRVSPSPGENNGVALVQLRRSTNVDIARSSFVSGTQKADTPTQALLVEESEGMRVTDSRFENISSGVNVRMSKNVKLEHNLFSRLGTFAILMAQVSGVEILSNRFNGFATEGSGTAAFIQCQTRGTTEPSKDILISNNVMISDTPTLAHGIFFSNEARIPFEKITVLDNIVVSGTNHGISVIRANDVKIIRNIVLDKSNPVLTTGIRIDFVNVSEISDNHTLAYTQLNSQNTITRRNTTIARRDTRTNQFQLERLDERLAGKGAGPVHGARFVTSEHRASGPRP